MLRYSALGLGVLYGFYHQRTITATQKAAAAKHEWDHKQSLIDKAKAEYAKSKLPPSARSAPEGMLFSAAPDRADAGMQVTARRLMQRFLQSLSIRWTRSLT